MAPTPSQPDGVPDATQATLLIVDDDRALTAVLREFFTDEGYAVHVAGTGADARRLVCDVAPWIVVLDMQLPDVAGSDLMREMRARPVPPDVIVATGFATSESTAVAVEAGAAAYLVKPIDLGRLATVVRRLVDERRRHGEPARLAAHVDRLQVLTRVNRLVSSSLDRHEVLSGIAEAAAELVDAPLVSVWLADEAARTVSVVAVSDAHSMGGFRETLAYGAGIAGWVAVHRRPADVPDVFTDPRIAPPLDWWRERGMTSLYCTPIIVRDALIGVLALYGRRPFRFGPEDLDVLDGLVAQATAAIRNAGLFATSERGRRTAEALAEVTATLAQSLDAGVVSQRIVETVRTLLGTKSSVLYRIEEGSGDLVAVATAQGEHPNERAEVRLACGAGAAGLAVAERRLVTTADILVDDRIALGEGLRARLRDAPHRAVLALPLIMRGDVVGAFAVRDRVGRVFDEDDRRLAHALADQAVLALHNADMFRESQERNRQLAAVHAVSAATAESLDLDSILPAAMERIAEAMGFEVVVLYLREEGGASFEISAHSGVSDGFVKAMSPMKVDEGVIGAVVRDGRPLVIEDVDSDARVARRGPLARDGIVSFTMAPVITQRGALGVLCVGMRTRHHSTPSEMDLLVSITHQIGVAVQRARLFASTMRQATRMARLAEVQRALAASIEPDVVARLIAESVLTLLGGGSSGVYRVEPTGDLSVVSVAGGAAGILTPGTILPRRESMVGLAIRERGVVITPNFLEDQRLGMTSAVREILTPMPYRSIVAAPLMRDDRAIGALWVGDAEDRVFDAEDIRAVEAFADQAALVLRNAALLQDARDRQRRLEALVEVNRQISGIQPLPVVLDNIAAALGRVLDAPAVGLHLRDGDDLVVVSTRGDAAKTMIRPRLKIGESLSGLVAATGKTLNVMNATSDPRFHPQHRAALQELGSQAWLGVPVMSGGRVLGVMHVRTPRPGGFTKSDETIAEAFAAQAAVAIANARLFEEAQRRRREAEELARMAQSLTEMLDAEGVAQHVAETVSAFFGSPFANVRLLDPDGWLVSIARAGAEVPLHAERRLPPGMGVARRAIAAGRVVTTPDALGESDMTFDAELRAALEASDKRAYACAPLRVKGQAIGSLVLADHTGRVFDAADCAVLQGFADEAAIAIENANLYQSLERRLGRLRTLGHLTELISSSLDLEKVLGEITRAVSRLVPGVVGSFWLADEAKRIMRVCAFSDERAAADFPGTTQAYGVGMAGWVAVHREPVEVPDIFSDPRFFLHDWWRAHGLRSYYAIPIIAGEAFLGVLNLHGPEPIRFTDEERELLDTFIAQATVAVRNARLFDATQAQRTQLTQILESTSDGIVFIGRDGRVETANGRAAELLGFDPADRGVQIIPLLRRRAAIVGDRTADELDRLLESPETEGRGELELVDPRRIVQWTSRPTLDASGTPLGLTLTFRDVTEEREIEQMKSDFVSFVTHQLRTPLAGIKWMLELAAQEPDVPASVLSYLADAQGSSERLISLVNDLLDIARLERGRLEVDPRPVDLGALTREVLDEMALLLKEKGHLLQVSIAPALPPVSVDPQLIRQTVLNMISNAVKYTPAGGRVTVRLAAPGDGTLLWSVEDTGIGVPKDAHRRLFEKFYRAENVYALETEGTGLGLYLVRLIVERFGGRVWCESEEGRGATFSFTLPLVHDGSHDGGHG